jgi:hypothetical protein
VDDQVTDWRGPRTVLVKAPLSVSAWSFMRGWYSLSAPPRHHWHPIVAIPAGDGSTPMETTETSGTALMPVNTLDRPSSAPGLLTSLKRTVYLVLYCRLTSGYCFGAGRPRRQSRRQLIHSAGADRVGALDRVLVSQYQPQLGAKGTVVVQMRAMPTFGTRHVPTFRAEGDALPVVSTTVQSTVEQQCRRPRVSGRDDSRVHLFGWSTG